MKNSLVMNFSIDKEKSTVNVEREFAASLDEVWAAWTQAELLDEWWAPKPYKTETKELNFREGGYWLYAMRGPNNEEHWCRADYKAISPRKSFSYQDAFCDRDGNINTEFPRSLWTNTFAGTGGTTTVSVHIKYDKREDLEKYIEMGFREGFTAALENLDEMLKQS